MHSRGYALTVDGPTVLTAEQTAVLRLVSSRGGYEEVAESLVLDVDSVAEAARESISLLGGDATESLTEKEADRVADWLLGVSDAEPLIEGSPAARELAAVVNARLSELEGMTVRDLPGQAARPRRFVRSGATAPADERPADAGRTTDVKTAPVESREETLEPPTAVERSPSKRGGAILIGALAVAATCGVLLLTGIFGSSGEESAGTKTNPTPTPPSTTPNGSDLPSSGNANGWRLGRAFALKATDGGRQQGAAAISTKQGRVALLVACNSLSPGSIVGTWLVGSDGSTLVSLNQVDSKGRFVLAAPMPAAARTSASLVVTRENFTPGGARPTRPGTPLLSTRFSL